MNRILCIAVFYILLSGHGHGQEKTLLPTRIVAAARAQIGSTTGYDPAYVSLRYPGGDVPVRTGVCSDVVIRALRPIGIDLQKEVHEDMLSSFDAYPKNWGLKKPDKNIDHRRVPNLMCYFERKHIRVAEKLQVAVSYAPGDIVVWDLGGGLLHIGIVSDNKVKDVPLIIHNIGSGAQEEDVLFKHRIIGHYRISQKN